MANVEKFGKSEAWAILQHDTRTKDTTKTMYKNKDIDPTRTANNYSLIDNSKEDAAYNRLKQRLSEVKVQQRADVKILCSWVVTLPADVRDSDERKFFQSAYEFMRDKYGTANIISADIHYDESRPHLHLTFVPVVKNTAKSRSGFAEKVSAKEVLTRKHLQTWHQELSAHVENDLGYKVSVITNTTSRNKSISELKAETAREIQAEKDKQQELTEIAENNAREAIEIHKKASALEQQNIALESQIKRLSERRTERRKPTLGKVLLSATEYSDLCDRADAVDNINDAYAELRDAQTGKTIKRLTDENKRLAQQNEQQKQESAKTEASLKQELKEQRERNSELVQIYHSQVQTLEEYERDIRLLTEIIKYVKDWIFERIPQCMQSTLERFNIRSPERERELTRSRGRSR